MSTTSYKIETYHHILVQLLREIGVDCYVADIASKVVIMDNSRVTQEEIDDLLIQIEQPDLYKSIKTLEIVYKELMIRGFVHGLKILRPL